METDTHTSIQQYYICPSTFRPILAVLKGTVIYTPWRVQRLLHSWLELVILYSNQISALTF
jgi:hypothetical protein